VIALLEVVAEFGGISLILWYSLDALWKAGLWKLNRNLRQRG